MHKSSGRRKTPNDTKKQQADIIINMICEHYRIKRHHIFYHVRDELVLEPRQVAMWVMRYVIEGVTFEEISWYFVQCHATVINAINKIDNILDVDKEYRYEVCELYLKAKELVCNSQKRQSNKVSQN